MPSIGGEAASRYGRGSGAASGDGGVTPARSAADRVSPRWRRHGLARFLKRRGRRGGRGMMTENFTWLPVGASVSSSRRVIRCPRCGRNGALEIGTDGERRCVHVEASAMSEGLLVEPTDHCDLQFPRE